MPLFAIVGRDGPAGRELRAQHRAAHLAHLEPLDRQGRIHHAGPLLEESGEPAGSVILLEASDFASARELAARDPYVVRGIFASYDVFETRIVFPRIVPRQEETS